jgi:hypothetical protein
MNGFFKFDFGAEPSLYFKRCSHILSVAENIFRQFVFLGLAFAGNALADDSA